MSEEEESRAVEYRRKMQAREDNALANEKALAGNSDRYVALLAKTFPLTKTNLRLNWDPKRKVKDNAE